MSFSATLKVSPGAIESALVMMEEEDFISFWVSPSCAFDVFVMAMLMLAMQSRVMKKFFMDIGSGFGGVRVMSLRDLGSVKM